MKKIIGILKPFDMYQTFYVYEDDNQIDIRHPKIDEIPDEICELSQLYGVDQVDLSGAKSYIQGIIKQIQEKEITKYNENKLIIKCI